MDLQKYNGNIHPDEWINDLIINFNHNTAKSLVDPTISLSTGINSYEELRNALKQDISFTVFKNTNKKKLQSLKYLPEREGGDTSEFISKFRKLCYNAEIEDVEEQKKYLYKSLPEDNNYIYFLTEFHKKMTNVNSMSELIKAFEEVIMDETNLIRNKSIVTLKHVATGKYLTLIEDLYYATGSKSQLVFVGSSGLDPNALWKVEFDNPYTKNKELVSYTRTNVIKLQHKVSTRFLGVDYYNINRRWEAYKSPLTNHTEVNCCGHSTYSRWKFNSKLENHQGYLKSNDIVNLGIKKSDGKEEFLRSHDFQFTIGSDTFQEVVCHNERLGGDDEWCIELIK